MHHRNSAAKTIICVVLSSVVVSGNTFAADYTPQVVQDTKGRVVTVQDQNGEDTFASIDNGPENLSVYINSDSKVAEAVQLTEGKERVTQQIAGDGTETLTYERETGSSVQTLLFNVDRNQNRLELASVSSTSDHVSSYGGTNRPSRELCSTSTDDEVAKLAFTLDLNSRSALLAKSAVVGCGDKQKEISTAAARLISSESRASNQYLSCASGYQKYAKAVLRALVKLSKPDASLFTCVDEPVSTKALNVLVGDDIVALSDERARTAALMELTIASTNLTNRTASIHLSKCCSSVEESAESCRLMRIMNGTPAPLGATAARALLEGFKAGRDDQTLQKFISEAVALRLQMLSKKRTVDETRLKIVKLCTQLLKVPSCSQLSLEEFATVAESTKPSRAQVAQISATSKPAAQSPAQQPRAKPGSTAPATPALPQLNQRITYQRNDPASVRQALKKYEYMGPLAAAARKTADSISAQVSNVAVAATDGPSGASSEGFSYQSEPVQFKTGGGSISRIQVGNRSVYVKSTIPFGNRVGEPQTSVGSSAENLQPVSNTGARVKPQDPKRAAAAATGSGSAALDSTGGGGAQEPLPSGGGVGPSAQTPSARTGAGSRSVSSAQQSRFKSVTEFNTALVNEKNPRQFLSQSTETLRELKLQIVLKGESFPRNPDYNPRIYDFDELKRMMKR